MIYKYPDHTDTSSFISIAYYPNGRIHQKDTVKNSKVVGRPTVYYSDGNLYQIDSLSNSPDAFSNQWDRIMTQFYENGNVSGRFSVRNGNIDGISRHFNIDGVLVKEYSSKDTIKDGDYKEFYKNGRVSFKATFSNDVPVGYEYFFDENGDTIKDSAVNKKGDFADNTKKTTTWIWFSRNGKEVKRKTEHSPNKMLVSLETN